ncbi:hypothetical protein ZEAMMB73_Zm00001d005805 [Zea mays]|uniref:ATP-dependent DNA helicase n=1 Tax=Zea mays TaxID=4577 RepID=A0A1D6EQX2_MAIZE|nr:hypothetical protein ZEAMMB73_Zm00001d005805 [Zea mays]
MGHNAGRTPLIDISNTSVTGDQIGSNSLGPIDDANERKRQRDRERYATMSIEQKNEKNRKRREARQRNKGLPLKSESSRDGDNKVNVDLDDDSDWLHRNETFQTNDYVATTDLLPPGSVHESVGVIGEPSIGVREYRLECLRLYNQTPKRKEAKIEYMRKRRVLQADTLNVASIAMEDPTYTPEVVHPATEPSTVTTCDWVIPEFVRTPFLPAQTQPEDVGSFDMSTEAIRRKHHVPRGERQTIKARRNKQSQASIARNVTTLNGDTIGDANNNDDDDDDEAVIFGEDDDDDEGYIFAGQCTYVNFYYDYDTKAYINTHVLVVVFQKISDEETDEDIEIDGTQDESTGTDVPDPYDKVYSNLPEETHMLKPVPDCGYCTAKKFEYEPPGFCCRGGKVFNVHFSFTSLYCCLDSMTTNVRDSGIYTFWAQGMMYHNIKSFGKEGGSEHKHLELYFYDDDPSLEHRYRKCREEQLQKDKEVIKQIVGILHGNPYSEHLRSMGHVENLDDYHIALNLDQTLNQKTYNTPLTSEVAAVWIKGSERRGQFSKSVMLHGKDRSSHVICSYHGCYDALSYPLFFPKGELGWHANIPKVGVSMDEVDAYRATHRANNSNDEDAESPTHLCVSVRDYYCYKFQIRPGVFNRILHGKWLFQQFAVDTYIKIESSRLDFIRKNQDRLRVDLYQGLVDSMLDGDIRAGKVGKRTVMSTSFIGSPHDMKRRYMDAMALVRKFGKPDIFLTMTCNPNWDEIRRELLLGQTPQDRPDLVVRVFHAKLQDDTTLQGKDSYPIYRRRDDGHKEKVRGCELDNRWVVPYNPYLLRLFNCHVNVEACGSIKAVKYLFKYIYKGHDRASVVMRYASKADDDVDEIKQYRDARWVTPPEALWRIYGFELSQNSPPVMQLQLHLPNMHMVAFHERKMVERVVNRPGADRSMLMAYFEANRLHEGAHGILYGDFPKWYTWQSGKGKMPSALRRLFATILVYCEPSDMAVLWQNHLDVMSEDYQHRSQGKTHVEQMVLIDIRNMLQSMGKDIKTFPLPPIIDTYDDAIGTAREVYEEETSIMPGGRTAHSRFKIPLTIDDGTVCSFTKQSGTAELLRKASLIIWDEASMTKRQAVEALDNSMRDIMGRPELPFGGKTIVFGGDFRQVLPVVRKGSRAQVVASSLWMSYVWESMSHLKLVSNMRAKNDPWFAEYLLRVGGGTEDTNSDGDICLPDEVCVPYSGSDSDLDNLIDFVFPNLNENMSNSTYITSRAILSTRNDWVDMINAKMIDRFQGEHMVYHSFDSAMDDPHNYYPPEFLNTLTPNGLPPHVLKLKIGCPIILLRNIDPANGLCNGTRLVVRGFQRNSIDAEIVLVNKAQGQTIPNVGVYLPEPVFSHGQLYVALSRATARSNIKILAIPAVDVKKRSRKGVKKNPIIDCGTCTKNIVYEEVLTN